MGIRERLKNTLIGPQPSTGPIVEQESDEERSLLPLSTNQWASMFSFGGLAYPFQIQMTMPGDHEDMVQNFTGYVQSAVKANGVVFGCMLARLCTFSEARFQFRQMRNGRPGDLFGTQELAILENPWPGATTGDLLARLIQDVDIGGNAFVLRRNSRLRRLRPDWVIIIIGVPGRPAESQEIMPGDLGSEILGYGYCPGGFQSGEDIQTIGVDEMAHFAPIPDPIAQYRGMSWITPVVREIMGDSAATSHKLKYWENGATVNLAITLDPSLNEDKFRRWVKEFKESHVGLENAYRTLVLAGGAQVTQVGSTLEQADFKNVQGAGETRIAAAAGVPPVIVGLSEGLQAATYSNYNLAMRRFGDITVRPLWRNLCGSLQNIMNVPPNSILWYDDRDIPFLRQEVTDLAKIRQADAVTMRQLIDGGFKPDTVVDAVTSNDLTRLVHTGLYSVQLQPPYTALQGQPASPPGQLTPGKEPAGNGDGNGQKPPAPAGNGQKPPQPAAPSPSGAKSDAITPYLSYEEIWEESDQPGGSDNG